jgi:catalase
VTFPTTNRIASAAVARPTLPQATLQGIRRGQLLRPQTGNDDYKQAGDLFRLMIASEENALIGHLAGHMKGISERIAKLRIEHYTKADPAYGRRVAEALGMPFGGARTRIPRSNSYSKN